jgi:hypothetical protein
MLSQQEAMGAQRRFVFPGLLRKAKQVCEQANITAVYGSTEAEPIAEVALSNISKEDFTGMERAKGVSRTNQFLRSHCGSFASSWVFRFRG